MFTETYNKAKVTGSDNMSLLNQEQHNQPIIGEYFDEITYTDGRREVTPIKHNLIVASFGKLLAALCKSHAGFAGVTYWEVGTGDVAWDTPPLPQPQLGDEFR
jgi:hypothetical protein